MLLPKPQKYSTRLAAIEKVSSKVYIEKFELVEPKEIAFFPGQTVMLFVAPGINRSMSIASVPDEKNSITLVHDVSPNGPFSKWAIAAKVGDPMNFMGPLGIFVMDKESPRNKMFVATGSGIAPYLAMAKDYLSHGGTSSVSLYWGLRHEEDIYWQKEFSDLEKHYTNFKFTLILSQSTDTWQGKRGHVEDYIFTDIKDLAGSDYYLCGSRMMTDEMRTKLKTAGVPDNQVKFELFY